MSFARRPVRAFLRQRLGFGVGTYADEVADALPVELDKLEEWQIGQRMLDARLAGATADAAADAERARGELPPGKLCEPVIAQIQPAGRAGLPSRRRPAAAVRPGRSPSTSGSRFRTGAGSAGPSPACAARCCAT